MQLTKYDNNTEIAVLGSILIDGRIINQLEGILTSEDFYLRKHQTLFKSMLEMSYKNISIDVVTLSTELKSRNLFEQIGGFNYLHYLIEFTPSSANFKHYADVVKEYSNKRKLTEQVQKIIYDMQGNKINPNTARSLIQELDIDTNSKSKLNPISAKDIDQDFEPVQSLWGEIIYPACITQINSDPGVGKTTLTYSLCLNGVMGKEFLGITFSKKLKVLYIDVETPHWKRAIKLRTISCESLPDDLHFIDSINLQADYSHLLKLCKKGKYDLVIFDTQSRILNLEQENDNSEANRAMGLLRRIANESGCSIVLIHHTSKSDKKGSYKGRGASAIGAAVDVVVNMEMLEEEDAIKLKVDKNRIMGDYQTLYIKKIGEDQFEPYIPQDKTDSGFEKFKVQDFILGLSTEHTIWPTGNILERGLDNGFSERNIKRAIRNLAETGKIKRVKHGMYEIPVKCHNVKMPNPSASEDGTLALLGNRLVQ